DGFGMSEAGTVTCMPLDLQLIRDHAGSTGIAMPGVHLRIVADDGHELPAGQAGELFLRGENIFAADWRRPDETAAAFTADGWFRTGDVAMLDGEGYLTLLDRKKDMYISGGENVFPAEVEALLAAHPNIAECAVIGVPDARWGEAGHVALVPRPGVTIDHSDVLAFLEPQLARFKLPKTTSIHESLPRTASGKLRKADLRDMLRGLNQA
ncbi:MAG TPA: AMP-binding protein, partial [Sphingomicrobium sp.]